MLELNFFACFSINMVFSVQSQFLVWKSLCKLNIKSPCRAAESQIDYLLYPTAQHSLVFIRCVHRPGVLQKVSFCCWLLCKRSCFMLLFWIVSFSSVDQREVLILCVEWMLSGGTRDQHQDHSSFKWCSWDVTLCVRRNVSSGDWREKQMPSS